MSVAQMKNQKLFNKNLSKQDSKNFTKTKALKKKLTKHFTLDLISWRKTILHFIMKKTTK